MKIGIDIDGVLANFVEGFTRLTREITGRNLFPSSYEDGNAPMWDWPQHFGYTDEEMEIVWNAIKHSTVFWRELSPFVSNWIALITELTIGIGGAACDFRAHDFYLITNRVGLTCKQQTDAWVRSYCNRDMGIEAPAVLISGQKGLVAQALQLDAYIDDNPENCMDVRRKSPQTRTFVLDRPYNRNMPPTVLRVSFLSQMFDDLITAFPTNLVASDYEGV